MSVSEAQKRATAKYERDNYDKVLVRFPKGTKDRIKDTGADSVNGYIIKCVLNALDGTQNAEKATKTATADKVPAREEKTAKEPFDLYALNEELKRKQRIANGEFMSVAKEEEERYIGNKDS